jgi:DNA-directed DNA polymerase III PolC
MIKRAVDLGRTHFSYTDLGHLSSCLKAYGQAKAANLKFAAGIEFFFKDSSCPIVVGTKADRCKYFNASIFAKNQDAYQEIVRVVSSNDMPKIKIRDELESLWSWKDLERLSKSDTLLVLGGPHCMVGKAMLADTPELAEKILLKIHSLFQDRLSMSLTCEPWEKKYATVIKIKYKDGTSDSLLSSDLVTTNKARKIKASDLTNRSGHFLVKSKVVGNTFHQVDKEIAEVTEHRGFLPLPVDVTSTINKFFVEMHKKHGIKLLASDYAFYSEKEDHIVQTMVLEGENKLKANLHMKSAQEIQEYLTHKLGLTEEESTKIIGNNNEWAKNFDNFELKYKWRLADAGENPLQQCLEIIKKKGLMRWKDTIWVGRLKEEIEVLAKNGIFDLSPYFLPIHDVINHYEENGRLPGPGRGSAAGSLVAYLMGVTKVNPFTYDLSFNRFYSMDRIKALKLADIDSDLESRDLLVGEDGKSGYLYKRWGNKAAQISTRTKIRLKSAIKDTNRYINGSVEKSIEVFAKSLPDADQGITDEQFIFGMEDDDGNHIDGLIETSEPLQKYANDRPKEWAIVRQALGITRAFSRHACAFVIADKPISEIVPIKDGNVVQYEATAAETAGLIKYDFLVISQLKDIRVCLDLINKKNKEKHKTGYFTNNGVLTYIWDLPTDQKTYESVWGGSTESCWQINTNSMIPFVKGIKPTSIEDLSIILSLVRPGPLDYIDKETGRSMAEEYVHRRDGGEYKDVEILKELIPETHSVLVYQEQVTKIAKQLAGFSGSAAENLREAIGKKKRATILKIKPDFIAGCLKSNKITEEEAQILWDRIVTFGRYAFNKSHGVSYAFVTYACIFLKHNYSLEWWAAVLTNAKEKEISGKLWPYVKHLVAAPDINLSTDEMEIDYANGKIRAKLGVIKGMAAATIDPIVAGRPYKDIEDFVNKEVAGDAVTRKLIHVGVLDSLFPPKLELLQKMQLFEDLLETNKFNNKIARSKEEGKKTRLEAPNKGVIKEEYLEIEKYPLKNAAVQKSILPSLLVGLTNLGINHSSLMDRKTMFKQAVMTKKARKKRQDNPNAKLNRDDGDHLPLLNGEEFEFVDQKSAEASVKDIEFAVFGYVVGTSFFDYSANTKQALKVIIDVDGYVKEHVMWPNYYSEKLEHPKELKKGNICMFLMKKRQGSGDPAAIEEIVIEA